MKLAGCLLISLCGALTGFLTASALSRRHSSTQSLIAMLGTASDRLRYLSPGIQSLIRLLAAQYPTFPFLADCRDRLAEGKPFPESWREALLLKPPSAQSAGLLLPLAAELGCTDLNSQLSALAFTSARLEELSAREREYLSTHAKLYRSLGALGGIALALLLY